MRIKRTAFLKHLGKLNLPKNGIAYIVRDYDENRPSRRGNGLFGAVHDTYASHKTGYTTNSESRHNEAPFLLSCELSNEVLYYADQPEHINITYVKKGRKVTHHATYDFLVIEQTSVYLVECKPYDTMLKLIEEAPHKYQRTANGFTCQPAVDAAAKYGFGFKIVTDRDFSVRYTRNCMYLLNFLPRAKDIKGDDISLIEGAIRESGNRVRMSDLRQAFTQTQIAAGILKSRLFFDIEQELLQEEEHCWIYADNLYLDLIKSAREEHELVPVTESLQLMGAPFVWWRGKEWQVLDTNENHHPALQIRLGNRNISFSRAELLKLINDRDLFIKVDPVDNICNPTKILCSSTATQIEQARQRKAELDGTAPVYASDRTIYRNRAKYEHAKKQYGDGFLGLIDQSHKKGNRTSRLIPAAEALLEKYFKQALKKSPGPANYYFTLYVAESEEVGLPPCSSKTFYKRFNKFCPDPKRTLLQKGMRASYALGPQAIKLSLDRSLPYHGDHAFQIAHIDHSPIEMQFISKLNGEPLKGTMQLSIMYDGYSRNILAIYVSFEKPSYRNTMMLLRECLKRHGTLPLMIAFDRGSDFESEYVDTTLAALGIHKRRRPVGYSRHGSGIERTFGISETELIHHLEGNKQLQKLGRSLSSTHNPNKSAIWTPDDFAFALHEFAYHIYPLTMRAGIADTPEHRFTQSVESFDDLPGVIPSSKSEFFIRTLPDTKGKNGMKSLNKNQIKFNHLLYRLSRRVEGYNGEKTSVKVKYDPYDIRTIWAKVNNQWVELHTVDTLVRECYDKGIQYAHLEVHGRTSKQALAYRKGKAKPKPSITTPQDIEKAQFSIEKNQSIYDQPPAYLEGYKLNLDDLDTYSIAEEEETVV